MKRQNENRIPISLNTCIAQSMFEHHNLNQLITGPSGSGITRHCVIPQISACVGNYIICDKSLQIYHQTAAILEKNGYHVMIVDADDYKYFFDIEPLDKERFQQDILNSIQPQIVFQEKCALFIRSSVFPDKGNYFYWEIICILLNAFSDAPSIYTNIIIDNLYMGPPRRTGKILCRSQREECSLCDYWTLPRTFC